MPYSKRASRRQTASIRSSTRCTSPRARTTGKRWGAFGSHHLVKPGQLDAEHLTVKEEQRR
ncbi:hypothetical protein, partial [Accumulibacter sp.]|uniref:hypothetical protein n=1 Tax=Accumulibacter sp. TaxID=2053492 RepID=UPI002D1F9F9D